MLFSSLTIFYIASMFGARLLSATVNKKNDNTMLAVEEDGISEVASIEKCESDHIDDVWIISKKREAFDLLIKGIFQKDDESIDLITKAFQRLRPYYAENGYSSFKDDVVSYIDDVIRHDKKLAIKQYGREISFADKNDIKVKLESESMKDYFEYQLRSLTYASLLQYYIDDEYKASNINKTKKEIADDLDSCFTDILCARNNKAELIKKDSQEVLKDKPQLFNYQMLLAKVGDVYNGFMSVYESIGLIDTKNRYSHEIVYEIAKLILEKTEFYFTRNLTVSRFAQDITDSNIDYFHNSVERKIGSKDKIMADLFCQYLDGRPIESYYYFLKMCMKIYESAIDSQLGENIESQVSLIEWIDTKDIDENIKTIQYNPEVLRFIIEKLKYRKYHFLYNVTDNRIKGDILAAYINRQKKLKKKGN